MKYFIIIACIAAAGGYAWYHDWDPAGAEDAASFSDALYTVKRDVLEITVLEEGYLKAKDSTKLSPKFDREGVISWLIDEGTEVKEGDVLVEFEKTEVENDVEEQENRLIQYDTELAVAKANLAIQERESEAAIDSAHVDVELSKMKLELYEQGEAPNQRDKLLLAVRKAGSEFDRAKERYQEVPDLLKEGFLTKIQAEEEKIHVEEAEMNLDTAKKELELHDNYSYEMQMTQLRNDLKDAERKLLNCTEMAGINMKEKEAQVQRQDRHYKSTKARLEEVTKELVAMTMKATQNGVVHYGDFDRSWRSDRIRVGGQVWSGMTVITIPDLDTMQAVVKIHEAEIDLVEEGMEVVVNVETAPDKVYKGQVSKIAAVATSDWSDTSNKTFKVEITMESTQGALRAGVSCKVEILVEEIPDVLQVPIHAVLSEGGEHFCFVPAAGEMAKRIVRVGKNNAHYVQILEGLEAGEQVLLYDPRENGIYTDTPGGANHKATDDEPAGLASGVVEASL